MPVIQCNGADLYYEDHGKGQPIIFLHGATAGLRYFEPQLTGMAGEHRPIAVDFRGHGRSEKTEFGHSIRHYARDIRAFLEQREIDDVILVGWSMGAIVSWEYIHQYGTNRLRAVVDVDMEPSPVKRADYDYGSYGIDDLEETLLYLRDYRTVLPEIDVPALVCAGADEKWRSVASVEYAADLIPDARFERFETSGHCLITEEPERFNRVLRGFIDSL